jgi:hypothetical protein
VIFLEPSGGIALGLEFNTSEKSQSEVGLTVDMAYRMYITDASAEWQEGISGGSVTQTSYKTSGISDFKIPFSLGYTYRRAIKGKVDLGFKVKVDGRYSALTISQEKDVSGTSTPVADISATGIYFAPDVAVGASFHLLPD